MPSVNSRTIGSGKERGKRCALKIRRAQDTGFLTSGSWSAVSVPMGKPWGGAFFKSWVTGGLRHELLHLSCYWNGVPCKNKPALHWLLSWWTGLCLWLPQRTPSASLLPESGNVFLFILSTQMHHVDSRGCFKTGTCFIFFLFFPALYLVLVLD